MNSTNNRNFNCKDEELPVVAKFVAFSLKRDLADFTAFSPMFTTSYVTSFETKITSITDLVEPQSETLAKSVITARYTATMNSMIDSANRISGYIKLAKADLKINDASFGLPALRKSIEKNDVEGAIANLHIVLVNINTFKATLAAKGLTDEFISNLTAASQSMSADKQQQYEITSNRRSIVQSNVSLLNDVYNQIAEINSVGKILYKGNDAAKLSDFIFTDLLKKVRQVRKDSTIDSANNTNTKTN